MTKPATQAESSTEAAVETPENEVLRLLRLRGTVRNFKSDPVPEHLIEAVIAAGQRAPTSSNMQAYSIVVVRDQQTKTVLTEIAGGHQAHVADCPVFFALCADLTRTDYACSMHGKQAWTEPLSKSCLS